MSAHVDRFSSRPPGSPVTEAAFRDTVRRATATVVAGFAVAATALLSLVLFLFHSAAQVNDATRAIAEVRAIDRVVAALESRFREARQTGVAPAAGELRDLQSSLDKHFKALTQRVEDDPAQADRAAALRNSLLAADWTAAAPEAPALAPARAQIAELISDEDSYRTAWWKTLNVVRIVVFSALALFVIAGLPVLIVWLRRLLGAINRTYQVSLAAAEQREAELRVSLRSIGDAVISTNAAGEVVFLNPVAEKLTGWTTGEAHGRPLTEVFDIINEKTGAQAVNPVERVLRERIVVGLANHTLLRARHGGETPIEDSAAPLLDDAGEVQGVILVFHDVAEKREIERRLAEAEWRARTSLEVGGAGAWVYDGQTGRITGDTMVARLFGVPLDRCMAGEPLESFLLQLHPDDRPRIEAALQHATETGEPYDIECRVRTEEGEERWLRASARMASDDVAPKRLIGFLLDITGARQSEATQRESAARFRFLNELGEATRDLAEPNELMATVARMLGAHLHASRCAYAEVEADGDRFTIPHDYTDGCASSVGRYHLSLFGARAVARMRGGETLVIRDVDLELTEDDGGAMFNAIGVKAIVCCPLVKAGVLRAMMAVHQTASRDWSEQDISLVGEVVERCWSVIERARAEAALRERARLAALRTDIAAALTSGDPLDAILQNCCSALVQHLDAAFARIWTVDELGRELLLRASAGLYTHLDGPHSRIPMGQFKIGRIAQNQQRHLTNEVAVDPNISDSEWARREGMVAFAGYPLILEGRTLGVLAMFSRHVLSEATLADLAPVADGITQCIKRRRAEAALHASETLKTAIINTSLDGFILMDHEGCIADWNEAAERLFGYPRDAVLNRSLGDTIVPERLREAHRNGVARYMATREARILGRRYELPALRADGSEFPCEISISHIPATEPPLFAGFVRDVTQRRKAEAAWRESEERLRLVVESATDLAIFTVDLEGCVTLWNPGAEQLFGWPAEEMLGQSFERLFSDEDRAAGAPALELETATNEGRCEDERWHVRRDGGRFFASGLTMPLRGSAEAAVGYLKVARDRTAQQLAEQERARLLEDAEQSRNEAERARQQAEGASKAKDDFLAALSHELRTPLTPVLMTAAALRQDERLPADAREQLGMIERNITLEARLIDDLLDLTRIAKGKLPLRPQPCDAHSLIGLTVEIVRDEAQAKAIAIDLDLAAQRTGLIADPARVQQVVWNLLRNAVKFTPTGGRISVRTRNEAADGEPGRLRIEVSDSGIGIAPDAIDKIFLPFEQAGYTGNHRFGGMGLGLAIARAIVDLHGGVIRAESAGQNRGATFIVEFPGASHAPSGVTEATLRSLRIERDNVSNGRHDGPAPSLRLLLVEDHEPTLQVLVRLLTRAGHQVVSASTMGDALTAAASGTFDAVISDVGLPDGTGTELMKKLRDLYGLSGIALSGYGMEDDLARSREAGFELHLTKPVDFSQLQRALREFPVREESSARD